MINYLSSYLNGLTHMASSLSTHIGPSFVEAKCFDKNNWKEEFSSHYKIEKDVIFNEIDISLNEVFNNFFGDKKIVESIEYWMSFYLDSPINIYELENVSELEFNNCIFYYVEGVYIVEYKDLVVSFMIGNNE